MICGGINVNWETLENVKKVPTIALVRAIGRLARFAGNTDKPVSVLTHSLVGARYLAESEHEHERLSAIHFFMHDLAEAIIADIPRPFKTKEIKKVEKTLLALIYEKIGIAPPDDFVGNVFVDYDFVGHVIDGLDSEICYHEAHEYGLTGFPHAPSANQRLADAVWLGAKHLPFERTISDAGLWLATANMIDAMSVEPSKTSPGIVGLWPCR